MTRGNPFRTNECTSGVEALLAKLFSYYYKEYCRESSVYPCEARKVLSSFISQGVSLGKGEAMMGK